MTILNYIIRMLVALFLGLSFIVSVLSYVEAKRFGVSVDLTTYISLGVFIIFAYFLWIIK